MLIETKDLKSIQPLLKKLTIPNAESHKGDNGKVLIIAGSDLFHSAAFWSAEIATHFADLVHFDSTEENNELFKKLKDTFRGGIIVSRNDLEYYLKEDEAVLVGPGMMRTKDPMIPTDEYDLSGFKDLEKIEHEGIRTYYLTKYLLTHFTDKKYILDAGALQMLDLNWIKKLKHKPILTPHQKEFERVFNVNISDLPEDEKIKMVVETAAQYKVVLLVKAVVDIITDGTTTYIVRGGNQGLTKGGSGDTLAGLCTALYAKNDPLISAVIASFVLKKAADVLAETKGYWYNTEDLITKIPEIMAEIAL